MSSLPHQFTDSGESLEVASLAREEPVTLEVRDDPLDDVVEPARLPLDRLVAPIGSDAPASEVRGDCVNDLGSISVLTDREAGPHLPSDRERRPRRDGNGEAPFSVDVSGDICREELATVARAGV